MVQPQTSHQPPARAVLEPYVNVTASAYTAKGGDRVIGVNRAGAVTVTLPTTEVRAGRTYTIKDESGAASTNNITVATEGTETIDGSAADLITADYGSKTYYSDGSNWFEAPATLVTKTLTAARGGALTYEGGTTSEATTTSTTGVDLIAASGLTCESVDPIFFTGSCRQHSNRAIGGIGLKVNTTVVGEASVTRTVLARSQGSGDAKHGHFSAFIGPRVSGYHRNASGSSRFSSGGGPESGDNVFLNSSASFPGGQITDLVIRAILSYSSGTAGADELHVYTQTRVSTSG